VRNRDRIRELSRELAAERAKRLRLEARSLAAKAALRARPTNPAAALKAAGITGGDQGKGRRLDRSAIADLYINLVGSPNLFGLAIRLNQARLAAMNADMHDEAARAPEICGCGLTESPSRTFAEGPEGPVESALVFDPTSASTPEGALQLVARVERLKPQAVYDVLQREHRRRTQAGEPALKLPKNPRYARARERTHAQKLKGWRRMPASEGLPNAPEK
jgi:hypothetical protein